MKILVSGSNGFIGSALVAALQFDGHRVVSLTRTARGSGTAEICWHPDQGEIDLLQLEGFDAVVHLAGESIAEGRWTAAKKKRILDSRVQGTSLLSESLSRLSKPPKVFVVASAIGFYGDRKDEILTESSPPGLGFLADVCKEWEQSAQPVVKKGIRLVNVRFGIILGLRGGALAKMLPPFKLGLGGRLGSGQQYMSWIALEDAVGAIRYVIKNESLQGPVNVVAPQPVKNIEFTKILGSVLRRPTYFPAPAFGLRLLLGEMADALLLSSARVKPKKLLDAGYTFRHPTLELALRSIL